MTLDTKFAAGMREQLIDTAAGRGPVARRSRRTHLAVGVASAAAAAVLLTAGAVVIATTFPGERIISNEGPTVTQQYTGSATVDIGVAPEGANAVRVTITCTSAGAFEVTHPLDSDGADGASWECGSATAVGSAVTFAPQSLVDGHVDIDVVTGPETTWTASVQFITSETTEWGVNAKGETYGVPNENGVPDLSPALASNCEVGYIYLTDLMTTKAGEDSWTIPVYESDGETVIGEFWIGNDAPFCEEQ